MKILRRKLICYSDQLIPETAEIDKYLLSFLGTNQPRIGYIPSASDPTRKYFQNQQAYYARYNINLEPNFELDNIYRPEHLDALFTADAIHLSGGNTFNFLHWLRVRNLLDALRQYVEQGGVLVGVSAGAILMTPDIRTALLCGDTAPIENIETGGLGLVDFAIVPHFGCYATLEQLENYSRENCITVYACSDSAGIVIEDDKVECIGNVKVIRNGLVTKL